MPARLVTTLFDRLNARWFGGRLPRAPVRFTRFPGHPTRLGLTRYAVGEPGAGWRQRSRGRIRDAPCCIELAARLSKNYHRAAQVLLHEMVHLAVLTAVGPARFMRLRPHGRRFRQEQRRLTRAGALDGLW